MDGRARRTQARSPGPSPPPCTPPTNAADLKLQCDDILVYPSRSSNDMARIFDTDDFIYQSQAARVLFGRGKVQTVPEELAHHNRGRVLILCSGSGAALAERLQSQAADRVVDVHHLPKSG